MASWGVEVKPTMPYRLSADDTRGRLRIYQAKLLAPSLVGAMPDARTRVLCSVGEKSPVLICTLVADKCETVVLTLEFEDQEDVVFSVQGQSSVHLSGYYIGPRDFGYGEPSGEDIAETESEESDCNDLDDEEDEYESDFIDDSELVEMHNIDVDGKYAPSLPRKSPAVVLEEVLEEEKAGNGGKSCLTKKKYWELVSDSDDADDDGSQYQLVAIPASKAQADSEDEDGFSIGEDEMLGDLYKKNEDEKGCSWFGVNSEDADEEKDPKCK